MMTATCIDTFLMNLRGTSQAQRSATFLDPKKVNLHDLELTDYMQLAHNFAKEIHFFNTHTPENPTGDWQKFFLAGDAETLQSFLDQAEINTDVTPHLTLFICFLKLLEHSKLRFNAITQRHLDFYYAEVLQIQKKPAQRDQVHLLFELAKNIDQYALPEQTQLLAGKDNNKDQSYFLCALGQNELSKALFPIGDMQKDDVRKMAEANNLHVHSKKDSTGICFIGERKFKDFLSGFLPAQPGEIHDIEGNKVGEHDGTMYFTIGQREGLGIGGPGEAWYVIDKDVKKNIVYTAQGSEHPKLFSKTLVATEMNWISENEPELNSSYTAKIRYRQSDQPLTLLKKVDNKYYFEFEEPQRAVTLGQYIVLYDENKCLGGWVIIERA